MSCSNNFALQFIFKKFTFRNFLEIVSKKTEKVHEKYSKYGKIADEIERVTPGQIEEFLKEVCDKYNRAVTEPGTAVGALGRLGY